MLLETRGGVDHLSSATENLGKPVAELAAPGSAIRRLTEAGVALLYQCGDVGGTGVQPLGHTMVKLGTQAEIEEEAGCRQHRRHYDRERQCELESDWEAAHNWPPVLRSR